MDRDTQHELLNYCEIWSTVSTHLVPNNCQLLKYAGFCPTMSCIAEAMDVKVPCQYMVPVAASIVHKCSDI